MTGKAAAAVVVVVGRGSFAGEKERKKKLRSYALPCNGRVRLNKKNTLKYTDKR